MKSPKKFPRKREVKLSQLTEEWVMQKTVILFFLVLLPCFDASLWPQKGRDARRTNRIQIQTNNTFDSKLSGCVKWSSPLVEVNNYQFDISAELLVHEENVISYAGWMLNASNGETLFLNSSSVIVGDPFIPNRFYSLYVENLFSFDATNLTIQGFHLEGTLKPIWEKPITLLGTPTAIYDVEILITNSTLLITNYLFDQKEIYLIAINPNDGTIRWNLTEKFTNVTIGFYPLWLLEFNQTILFSFQNGKNATLLALDESSGNVTWRVDREETFFGSSSITDDGIQLTSSGNHTFGIDVKTGNFLWNNQFPSISAFILTPNPNIVLFRYFRIGIDGGLYGYGALNPSTGEIYFVKGEENHFSQDFIFVVNDVVVLYTPADGLYWKSMKNINQSNVNELANLQTNNYCLGKYEHKMDEGVMIDISRNTIYFLYSMGTQNQIVALDMSGDCECNPQPALSSSKDDDAFKQIYWVVIGVLGGLLVLAIIVVIIITMKKRRNKGYTEIPH